MAFEVIPLGKIIENGELTRIALSLNTHLKNPATKGLLQTRHLLGTIRRHGGSVSGSEQAVTTARQLHTASKLGVYALKADSKYVGMATVDPYPVLRKQVTSIPPKYALGPLKQTIEVSGPELTAWVAPGHGPDGLKNLTEAYKVLRTPFGVAADMYAKYANENNSAPIDALAWTIEPQDAPQWIHSAIRHAGFINERQNIGCYDDGETKRYSPPISKLYTASSSIA